MLLFLDMRRASAPRVRTDFCHAVFYLAMNGESTCGMV